MTTAESGIKISVVIPAYNAAWCLPRCLKSVFAQTLKPLEIIVIDDGSTDITPQLIDAAAARHPWIHAVYRTDRGFRNQGGGVIEAFYDGYAQLSTLKQPATAPLQDSITPAPLVSTFPNPNQHPRLIS